jgi:hypothetical protein
MVKPPQVAESSVNFDARVITSRFFISRKALGLGLEILRSKLMKKHLKMDALTVTFVICIGVWVGFNIRGRRMRFAAVRPRLKLS